MGDGRFPQGYVGVIFLSPSAAEPTASAPLLVVAASVPVVTSASEFAEFARLHLPLPLAERWIGLMRPGVVVPSNGIDPGSPEPIGLRGGGEPMLADDVAWPMFENCVPMRFIAELDCAALTAVGGLESMPTSGHLLFFCVDYWYEAEGLDDGWRDRVDPWTGGKVLYLPDRAERQARPAPPGLAELEPLELTQCPARAAGTPPSSASVWAERYFGPEAGAAIDRHMRYVMRSQTPPTSDEYPLWASDFELGIHERRCYVQSGGHPYDVQRPPEIEAARRVLQRDGIVDPDDTSVLDEAERWRLLLQDAVDESGNMIGYWLVREDDLAVGRFDRVYFDTQC